MPTYAELGKEELTTLKTALTEEYETYKAQGLSLTWRAAGLRSARFEHAHVGHPAFFQ